MHVHWLLPGKRTHLGRRNCCCFHLASFICLLPPIFVCQRGSLLLSPDHTCWQANNMGRPHFAKTDLAKKAVLDNFGFGWTQRPKSQNFPEYIVIRKNFPSNFDNRQKSTELIHTHYRSEPKKTIRGNWRTVRLLSPTKYFNIYRCSVSKLNPSCLRFDFFRIVSCLVFVFLVVLVFHLNDISGSI